MEKTVAAGRPPTLRDVAAAAGVSAMTVSNVIGGSRHVREETRRRVLRAIAELNYRPATSARNLRLGKRHAIGVVIVDETKDFLSSPFIARFVAGLCGVLNENGYVMIVQGIHPDEFESSFPLRRAEADAYCIRLNGNAGQRARMLEVLGRLDDPLILVQEILPLSGTDRMTIRQDDYGGAQLLADHLLARDVRSAVVIAPRFGGPMTTARLAGFRDAFAGSRQKIALDVVTAEANTFASGVAAITAYLAGRKPPGAIIGVNDELALAGLRVLQDRGLRVPEDVMVTGFNGFEPSSYTRPSLTTVVSPAGQIGAEAGRMLMRRLAGEPFPPVDHVLPVAVRKGDSTR
jgi:DNA-binding LacI/PurR family transcriptional regulator